MASSKALPLITVLLGGVLLSAISIVGSTWVLLVRADGYPTNARLLSVDSQFWRSVHNSSTGTEWVTLSDWGHDMVNAGPGLEVVPYWAAPRIERNTGGIQRVGTLRAGWPCPWIGAWWASSRRDENWPPAPFDEDLGEGLEDAVDRFLAREDRPTYFLDWGGLLINLLVLAVPWWIVLGLAAWRGAPVKWGYPSDKKSAG